MKNFLKKSIATGVVFNGLTTVAKSIYSEGGIKNGIAELGKDSLKVFGTSFITSTLPAVLSNTADKFVVQKYTDNKVVQHVALAAESIALTSVKTIFTSTKTNLQTSSSQTEKVLTSDNNDQENSVQEPVNNCKPNQTSSNNSYNYYYLDVCNTWAQAEVMKYLDLFSSDEVLHPELV